MIPMLAAQFAEIKEAYETLTQPAKKKLLPAAAMVCTKHRAKNNTASYNAG